MDEDLQKLLEFALRYVSMRPRSVWEMRKYLVEKQNKWKIHDGVVEKVILRLTELGYLDDRKFVEYWVHARRGRRPKGEKVIKWELKEHGVDEVLINVILALDNGEESEENLARRAGENKMKIWGKLPKLVQKKKLADYLIRRGFKSGVVWHVIDEIVGKSYN